MYSIHQLQAQLQFTCADLSLSASWHYAEFEWRMEEMVVFLSYNILIDSSVW